MRIFFYYTSHLTRHKYTVQYKYFTTKAELPKSSHILSLTITDKSCTRIMKNTRYPYYLCVVTRMGCFSSSSVIAGMAPTTLRFLMMGVRDTFLSSESTISSTGA